MTLSADINVLLKSYSRKGGKCYRKLQISRLLQFAKFAESRGVFEIGQVGEKTFQAFFIENALSEKTQRAYKQAFACLKREKENLIQQQKHQ